MNQSIDLVVTSSSHVSFFFFPGKVLRTEVNCVKLRTESLVRSLSRYSESHQV